MKDIFSKALKNKDMNLMKKVAKSDLHNHATRGGNIKNIEKLKNIKIDRLNYKFENLDEMQDWYTKNIKKHFQGKKGYENRIKFAFEQAKEDGIKKLCMSFGYDEYKLYGNIQDWINAIDKEYSDYKNIIDFIPELAFNWGIDPQYAESIFDKISSYNYFKSLDMYGNELSAPAKIYKNLYKKADEKKFTLKAHVGEFGDAESVKTAVEELNLTQIQHGINASKSEYVINLLKDNKIQLNICPSSNLYLKRTDSYQNHPIKILFNKGIKVTINTDDMIIFDNSVSQEYFNLYNNNVLGIDELNEIRKTGLN